MFKLRATFHHTFLFLSQKEVNGDVVIEGTLSGKELEAENIHLQMLNNRKWSPQQWLSYTKNQTIAGGKDASILIVKELITTAEIDLLKGNKFS